MWSSALGPYARSTRPIAVRLWVERPQGGDVSLFVESPCAAGCRSGRGSYGFRGDLVTRGMLKASHRRLDPVLSRPDEPLPSHDFAEPLAPGEIVPVDVALLRPATLFRVGEELRLDVQGRWFFPRNPLTGQFPAGYQRAERGLCVLHTGGEHDS